MFVSGEAERGQGEKGEERESFCTLSLFRSELALSVLARCSSQLAPAFFAPFSSSLSGRKTKQTDEASSGPRGLCAQSQRLPCVLELRLIVIFVLRIREEVKKGTPVGKGRRCGSRTSEQAAAAFRAKNFLKREKLNPLSLSLRSSISSVPQLLLVSTLGCGVGVIQYVC